MDYEKKYKDALAKAREIHRNEDEKRFDMEWLFPELKENEDERIRKDIIRYLKESIGDEDIISPWLTWLEMQGNNTPTIIWHNIDEKPEEMKELFCEWESDDATWHDVAFYDEESHTFRHAKMPINVTKWVYVDELLEKQGEQKPVIDFKAKNWYVSKVDGKIHNIYYSVDKVEPKFKVGDWILYSGDHYEGVRHITKIDEDGYYIERNGLPHGIIPFNHEICMRLWTIQDAKDGDVLHSIGFHNDCIFIFNGLDNDGYREVATGYCCIFVSADKIEFGIQGPDGIEIDTVKPATKIQRDLLFQKMKDAGYEFDFEKKELKKIEDEIDDDKVVIKKGEKSAEWSDEDKDMVRYIGNAITCEKSAKYLEEKGIDMIKAHRWLESLEPQPKEWSDEDEHRVEDTIYFLDTAKKHYASTIELDACIDWLKSLKDRIIV